MNMTDKIIATYLSNLKAAYPWARGENGAVAQSRGLELAEQAARKACAGKLKLEGTVWDAALRTNGFTASRYSMNALALHCGEL